MAFQIMLYVLRFASVMNRGPPEIYETVSMVSHI